jgi:septum formation protein
MAQDLILASTSIYRAELLRKLGIPFQSMKPNVNEDDLKKTALIDKKSPLELAEFLSRQKTQSVFTNEFTVIGGDQLVCFNNGVRGKPHTKENAFRQLEEMNGQTHQLITAVTVMTPNKVFHINHITELKMKKLSSDEIKNYIETDLPLDCAGSYKIEKSGICLFEKIQTDDFSAIQGLPLIWLSNTLKGCGYELFKK